MQLEQVETEPLPLLAATCTLILGTFLPGEQARRVPARHAARRRRDSELVLAGFLLAGLGAASALIGAPAVAAWAWIAGAVTEWALSAVRLRR